MLEQKVAAMASKAAGVMVMRILEMEASPALTRISNGRCGVCCLSRRGLSPESLLNEFGERPSSTASRPGESYSDVILRLVQLGAG
jgi:hypothetical protein